MRQQKLPNFALGAQGEHQAAAYLKTHSYQILDTNVRYGNHEVDIIALDQNAQELAFVEVKTRSQSYSGHPSQAVTYHKLQSLRQVARNYLQEKHLDKDYRFDIICILPTGIEHYENITWNRHKA